MGVLNEQDKKNDIEHEEEDRNASSLAFALQVLCSNYKLGDDQRKALMSILRQQLAELSIKLSFFVNADAVRVRLMMTNPMYGARELYPEVEETEVTNVEA